MALLEFKDLSFDDLGDKIKVNFLKIFFFEADRSELQDIGKFKLNRNSIEFEASEKTARNKFNRIIEKGFLELKNGISKNPAYYIHQASGIPLRGLNSFGLVDRNTNIIEIKPLTNCNMNCIFCSVDEGKDSRKKADYVVEPSYLVSEFNKLVEEKECDCIEALFNPNGEPTLYAPLIEVICEIKKNPKVKWITMNTNGSLLNEAFVLELKKAGMTRINLSLNAITKEKAQQLEGTKAYNPERVQEIARFITKHMELNIAPVYVPGFSDGELEKICEFVLELKKDAKFDIKIGIQNMLYYQFGRNPAEEMPFDDFFAMLRGLEAKYGLKLVLTEEDFSIIKTKKIEKPFIKGDTVKARLVLPGRIKGEKIAASGGRLISVIKCHKESGDIKVKILKDKHNIFFAESVG